MRSASTLPTVADAKLGQRRRGLIIIAIIVLFVVGGLLLRSRALSQSSRRVDAAQAELLPAYRRTDVKRLHITYQKGLFASPTGTPDLSMFPTVAHASLERATFPDQSSMRAIYRVDAGWSGDRCITVEASGAGHPSTVDLSVDSCS